MDLLCHALLSVSATLYHGSTINVLRTERRALVDRGENAAADQTGLQGSKQDLLTAGEC